MTVKKKLALLVTGLVIAVAITLHFIPIATTSGVFANVDSTTCIGYTEPFTYDHRVILGEMSDYNLQKHLLAPSSNDMPCGKPVELRLYLW